MIRFWLWNKRERKVSSHIKDFLFVQCKGELKFRSSSFTTCAIRQTGCVAARREQWCHSICHLKQRCQMRQWRIKYRRPTSSPSLHFNPIFSCLYFFLFLLSPSFVLFSHFPLSSCLCREINSRDYSCLRKYRQSQTSNMAKTQRVMYLTWKQRLKWDEQFRSVLLSERIPNAFLKVQ